MKVRLEDVRVDSFATGPVPAETRGTVQAYEATSATCKWSCTPYYTCPECATPVMPGRDPAE